jgi:hypothetical protein
MKYSIRAAVTYSLLLISPSSAWAAIRVCQPIVSSNIAVAPDELGAKKKALDQWREKALKSGPGYDVWRLAAEKSLKCFKKADGTHECVAFGAPCLIQQNPKQKPAGKDGKGIEM